MLSELMFQTEESYKSLEYQVLRNNMAHATSNAIIVVHQVDHPELLTI